MSDCDVSQMDEMMSREETQEDYEERMEQEGYNKIFKKYNKTHDIEKVPGTSVRMQDLNDDQSVCWGDGKTYHYLLTKK